ncbi:MAG: hypothetical protein HY079_05480 [Elusimicrobia bacterium]|nr:hypothetical protein [Elusimicrobiota bacterium]
MARRRLSGGRAALLAGLALAGAPFVLGAVVNPDLWWHFSAARWMLAHRALPRADFLSWTLAGAPWIDFEWLSELFLYGAHAAAGPAGLIAVRALCFAGALWCVLRMLARREVPERARGAAALLFGAALLPLADARPDGFSVLLFAVLLDALDELRLEKRPYRPAHAAACFGLFALWSNLHLGLAYGLLLIGFFAAGEALESLWARRLPSMRKGSRLREYGALLLAGAAGTLVNPRGAGVYAALASHARDLGLLERLIAEWRAPELTNPWVWPYALLLALTTAAVLGAVARGRRTHFGVLLSAGYFGWASTQHVRHLPYFAVAAVPALFEALLALQPTERELRFGRRAAAAVFVLLAAHAARFVWPTFPLATGSLWQSVSGRRLADYLESEPALAGRRLFHSWGYGGYLGYRLGDRIPVFYDGRYIFHAMYKESQDAFASPKSWTAFLDARGVEVAALGRRDKPGADGRPYYIAYMPPSDWALVAWNDLDLVFVRRAAFPPAWLKAHAYRVLLPDDEARLLQESAEHKLDLKTFDAEAARHAAQPAVSPRETEFVATLRHRLD